MWRSLHSLPGLVSLVLVVLLAISGAILSVYPMGDSFRPEVQDPAGLSVADVVGAVTAGFADIESLTRKPNGAVEMSYFDDAGMPARAYVDIRTGEVLRPLDQGASFYTALKDFHRAFFLNDRGRMLAGAGAGLLALISISGLFFLVARMGGWARLLDRPKGNWSARIHTILSRLVLLPLLLSSLTGVYIVLTEFELLPVVNAESVLYPESTQDLAEVPPASLQGLKDIAFADMTELTFPIPGDTFDIFTVRTASGLVLIDQFTGKVLERVPFTLSERLYALLYKMHTGVGLAWLGVILGLASLSVPLIGLTGVVIWWKRTRGTKQKIRGNHPAGSADIVVLVGSEGGSTWGFARSMHRDLTAAGHKVHVAPMNAFKDHYAKARHVLFLASTYGNGNAPATGNRFLSIIADMTAAPEWSFAVLGFGDRAFPHYCQFAKDVDADLTNHGWTQLMPVSFVNRQSTQAYGSWGEELTRVIGSPAVLSHEIELPRTRKLKLDAKTVYGSDPESATAVLRFAFADEHRPTITDRLLGRDGKRPRFAPSDLLGVLPPDSNVPRFYSVASTPSNDAVEICVKKQPGGLCSGFLHGLEIGGEIECFVRTNPDFRMAPGRKPVIMIGAGTGMAPFMGMIRSNTRRRPVHLFWGGRNPDADFIYRDVLETCLEEGSLTSLTTAFSRVSDRAYVQDKIRENADSIAQMLRGGASVMVCGGDAMAQAVAQEIEEILAQIGQTLTQMRARGLYMEDVF